MDSETQLTVDYTTKAIRNLKPPHEMNIFIDKDACDRFVESRNTPKFQVKSQRGKENRAKKSIYIDCLVEDMKNWRRHLLKKKRKHSEQEMWDPSLSLDYTP